MNKKKILRSGNFSCAIPRKELKEVVKKGFGHTSPEHIADMLENKKITIAELAETFITAYKDVNPGILSLRKNRKKQLRYV